MLFLERKMVGDVILKETPYPDTYTSRVKNLSVRPPYHKPAPNLQASYHVLVLDLFTG